MDFSCFFKGHFTLYLLPCPTADQPQVCTHSHTPPPINKISHTANSLHTWNKEEVWQRHLLLKKLYSHSRKTIYGKESLVHNNNKKFAVIFSVFLLLILHGTPTHFKTAQLRKVEMQRTFSVLVLHLITSSFLFFF